MKIINRSEQKLEDTWNLEKIFKSDKVFKTEINKLSNDIDDLDKYKNKVLKSSKNLYNILLLDENISRRLEKIMTYALRKYDQDLSDTTNQKLNSLFEILYSKYLEKSSYITPEILLGDKKLIDSYIKELPELANYKLLLSRLFRLKKHILSKEEESVLSKLNNSLNVTSKLASIIRDSEMQFSDVKYKGHTYQVNNETFVSLLKNKNRGLREKVFNSFYNDYSKYKDTLGESLIGYALQNSRISKLRKFPSSIDSFLYGTEVDKEIYNNLVNTVSNNLNVIYKYYDVLAKTTKLKNYSLIDTYINTSKYKPKKYTFNESKKIVLDVVKVFGKDYLDKANYIFDNRVIDIYPNKGKRGGAYSSGSYDTDPYILLNHLDDYNGLSTLIHELGHSIHTMYSNQSNPYIYSSYKIFVAEVASTVNELLLAYYILDNSKNKEEKKFILNEVMKNYKATLYRQTMFSEFEYNLYELVDNDKVITSDDLSSMYLELNKKYFGPKVVIPDLIKYEWLRIPHFYYNFYTYQYATGLAAASAIVKRIRNNEENAVEDYIKFLKSGNSLDPVKELKLAKIDMDDKKVIQDAIDMFDEFIEQYKKLI